jgi:hypothetical protein
MEKAHPKIKLPKLPKLTKKREGFVKDFVETGNATEAVVRNYDVKDRNVAKTVGSELLTFPNVIEAVEIIKKSLADAIPDELVTEKHIALLNKKEMKRTFNHDTGEWIEVETGEVDTQAVSKGVEMAYKLKKAFGENETPKNPSGNTYNFIFSDEVRSKVQAIDEMIKSALTKPKDA